MAIIPVNQLPSSGGQSKQSSGGNQVIGQLLSKVNPNQIAYSVAGGTAPQDIGGALADKITGKKSMIGGIAPQAEGMRMAGVNSITQDPISNMALNIITDPMTYAGLGVSTKTAKGVIEAEGSLQKAKQAKTALDSLRDTLGKAKSIAIQEVQDVPTKLDMRPSNNLLSDKVLKAIENPIYNVERNADGSLKQTVGNLDKVKEAVGELINTPKVWEEAPNKELRIVKQFYGQVAEAMKSAARNANKPIDEALDAYSKFMDNYHVVNKTLVDSAGNAMGNKLKAAFKLGAEPAVKQAWKEVSQASPGVKKVMNTMNHRELLGNLLKFSKIGAPTAVGAYGVSKIAKIAGNISGGGDFTDSSDN